MTVESSRIHEVKTAPPGPGRYVLYWMQASVRAEHNPALEHAIGLANDLGQPVLACFGLTDDYPEANERHFRFLLEGLQAAASGLKRRKVKLVVRLGSPPEVARELAADASAVVTDVGYLRHQRRWRRELKSSIDTPLVAVEGNVVVPVDVVSDKREYAARTIRPKIRRHLDEYLRPLPTRTLRQGSLGLRVAGERIDDKLLNGMAIDRSVGSVSDRFEGGTFQARAALDKFIELRLARYERNRNQPQSDAVSFQAMYLNYGHVSPVAVALAVRDSGAPRDEVETYLEELIVRRELAVNFVCREPDYDQYRALPDWSQATLAEHRNDERPHVYTRRELENAKTDDPYWNAAMIELRETGYMHNHMRMYWGKKILEWTNTPEYAFRTTLALNNRYGLDGRAASSFSNVGWVFGLHDQAWQERDVFGKVRYMNAAGLKRKADPDAYVKKITRSTGIEVRGG